MRFWQREKGRRKKLYAAKKAIKIWDVFAVNIVTSKLVKTKTSSNSMIGYLDKAIKPLKLVNMLRHIKSKCLYVQLMKSY